jgi:hypothetical protein
VITLGYVPARIFEKSMDSFYSTISKEMDITHIFVYQHYPLDEEHNKPALFNICNKYGLTILDPQKNLGLHEGFNWALAQLPIQDEDIIIGFDGDSHPLTQGWDKAFATALEDNRLVWASLWSQRAEDRINEVGYIVHGVRNVRVFILRDAIMNSICAWNAKFLKDIGGLSELLQYYGHLEASMFPKLKALNKEWVVLPDYFESDSFRILQDKEYLRWKWYYAHKKLISISFDEYVAQGCPILAPFPDDIP